jgi:nickel-dependent lactate racemase
MVRLPYGESYLNISPPRIGVVTVFSPKKPRPLAHPQSYAQRKIHDYFDKNKTYFAKFRGKRACLVASDNTRLAFNHVIIPFVLNELTHFGVQRNDITILVSNGLHAPMSRRALIENMGKEVVSDFNVENHDPNGDLVYLGTTKRRTPLYFNARYMKSDLKIATGLIAPHFHAGFGGGCKSILPGISGKITILKNHSYNMVKDPNARYGITSGNPIYEDILEGGLRSGLDLIVNVAVDSHHKMTHLFIGEPRTTHEKASKVIAQDMKIAFGEPYDIVVTTNGGYPLDRNLYQCVKGIAIGEMMVRKGGTIILASECRDGVGHSVFQKRMTQSLSPQEVLQKLKADEPVEDQDNIQILARALQHARVIIISMGIEAQTIRSMKMEHVNSFEEALRLCNLQGKTRMAVVPGGPYVLPVRSRQ